MSVENVVSKISTEEMNALTEQGFTPADSYSEVKGEELSTIGGLRDQCIQVIQIVENLEQEAAMASEK